MEEHSWFRGTKSSPRRSSIVRGHRYIGGVSLSIIESRIAGSSRGDLVLLGLSGDVDLATIPRLSDALTRVIARGDKMVAVDLDGITVLDDAALGVVLSAAARLSASGGTLTIIVTEPRIHAFLVSTRLDEIVSVEPSIDAILATRS